MKFTSPLVRLEAAMVLATRQGRMPCAVEADFDAILFEAGLEIMPIPDEIGRAAVAAFQLYGKGRQHPAQLHPSDITPMISELITPARQQSENGIYDF